MATASCSGNGTSPFVQTPPPGSEPAFNAGNPNHVLHVFEDWSTYTTPNTINTTNRVDGGGPWVDQDASRQTFSTSNNDPWFGRKTISIDFQDPPASAGDAHYRGFELLQGGAPPRYLNAASAHPCLVIEWAFRSSGSALYVGKVADWNPGGLDELGRFNFQNSYDPLGAQVRTSCDADPHCSRYYVNDQPRTLPTRPAIPPLGILGFQFARGSNLMGYGALGVHFYPQNINYGSGSGQFRYAENQLLDNVWRRVVIRLTLDQPGRAHGHGRIEQWIQRAGETSVKLMDYVGDVGGFDQGLTFVGPNTETWFSSGAAGLHWYALTATLGNFDGGNTTHLGYFRMWSHPRSEL
jgi:hypothetical protein